MKKSPELYVTEKAKVIADELKKMVNKLLQLPDVEKSDIELVKAGHVAVLAVRRGHKILMGKRRDSGKWTLPGGHLNPGEKPHEGAKRELHEETGIKKKNVTHLSSHRLKTASGERKHIHAFEVSHRDTSTNSKHDPDQEVHQWEWVDAKHGLPDHVLNNLHTPKNIVLHKLGLMPKGQGKKGPGSRGGVVIGHTKTGKPVYQSSKKSEFEFVIDLLKSTRPHKYLRKYRRGSRWIYVYHEAEQHGRALSDEAHRHLKELAELGDEDARNLIATTEEHHPEKLDMLRKLADMGDTEAHGHLRSLGIDREAEKLEDAVSANHDPIDRELNDADRNRVLASFKNALDTKVFGYLQGHQNSPLAQKLREHNITTASILEPLRNGSERSLRGLLKGLHEQLGRMDRAHEGLTSQNQEVRDHGSYGNLAYNTAIRSLEANSILPQGYGEIHKRKLGADHNVPDVGPIQEKIERKKRQAEERERRELADLHGSMAHHIASMIGGSSEQKIRKARELDRAVRHIFGKSLKKEDWPYDFSAHGITVKIDYVEVRGNSISMSLKAFDANGNQITRSWSRDWDNADGRGPHIHNSFLTVHSNARGNARIGQLINHAQQQLMLKHAPTSGTVTVTAAMDVGGYNWRNQGFSFDSSSQLTHYRREFKVYARNMGIELSDEDMLSFTEPAHFANFHDGKFYELHHGMSMKLSPQQISTRSLCGRAGEMPLTDEEIRNGKSQRMAVHLGKKFMLGRSWHGIWKASRATHRNNVAQRVFENYAQHRDRILDFFDSAYKTIVKRVKKTAKPSRARASRATATRAGPR